jgi:hypothetical protein
MRPATSTESQQSSQGQSPDTYEGIRIRSANSFDVSPGANSFVQVSVDDGVVGLLVKRYAKQPSDSEWVLDCMRLRMSIASIESPDPKVHSTNIQAALKELIDHAREDISKVSEPRFQALLETTAEVLTGLETAFKHYAEGREIAWR